MSEAKRKLVRLSVLIFPGLYLFLDKNIILIFLGFIGFAFLFLEITRFFVPALTKSYFRYLPWLAKERERGKISGISWIAWGTFLAILFFEKNIAIPAILFMTLGDAGAAIVRTKIQKFKIWNKGIEGNAACLIICLAVGILIKDFFGLTLVSIIAASFTATLIELIPLRIKYFYIDDNFSMTLASGLVMTILVS